jgi:hypothetical protein
MAKRASNLWDEDKVEHGQCPVCLRLYPLLGKDKNGQPLKLKPTCSCKVEVAGDSNVSRRRRT